MRLLSYIVGVSAVISHIDVLSCSRTIAILPKVDGLIASSAQNHRLLPNTHLPMSLQQPCMKVCMVYGAAHLLLPWGRNWSMLRCQACIYQWRRARCSAFASVPF